MNHECSISGGDFRKESNVGLFILSLVFGRRIMATMVQSGVYARPGFKVIVAPGTDYRMDGPGGQAVLCHTRPTVTVSGDYSLLSREEIIACDRFVEYERSDLDWALPLGLCRISRVPYRVGDPACMEMFCCGLSGVLVCIAEPSVDLSGPVAMTTVLFKLYT